jgi:hypothetical protein
MKSQKAIVIGKVFVTTSPKFSMQVDVSHKHYGSCSYSAPKEISDWLGEHGIGQYSYCGGGSWGGGFDPNGHSNRYSTYMIYNMPNEEDGLAFKIQFPFCTVYISEQFDWEKAYAEEAEERAKKEVRLQRRRDLYASKKNSNLRPDERTS